MNTVFEILIRAVLIGIGATVVMDAVAIAAKRVFGIPTSDWAMVGRWIGHFRHGRFRHDSMAKAAPIAGELALGWITHYVTGIAYAAVVIAIGGLEWARNPSPGLAGIVGVSALVAPFFLMQPAMGAGIAAAKTPKPNQARLRSLMNHVAFGIGLYLAALAVGMLPF